MVVCAQDKGEQNAEQACNDGRKDAEHPRHPASTVALGQRCYRLSLVQLFGMKAILCALLFALSGCGGSEDYYSAGNHSTTTSNGSVVIYRGEYPGWPWVARTPGGRLLCVFREGTVHAYSSMGRIMLAESFDGGLSWNSARAIADEPLVDDRNAAILVLGETDWLVSYNTFTSDEVSRVKTIRTRDGGQTWTQPQTVSDEDLRARSAGILTSQGELVLPLYRSPGDGAVVAKSSDDGETWTTIRLPDAHGYIGDEWSIAEIDGRLIGIHRNNHPATDGSFWLTENFGVPRKTNIMSRGFPSPAQITSHNGLPLLVYPSERFVSVSTATASATDLLTWQEAPAYRYESRLRDGSYPVSVQVSPARSLIVDYEIRDGAHLISGHFVSTP
jgi:hypothetical protein